MIIMDDYLMTTYYRPRGSVALSFRAEIKTSKFAKAFDVSESLVVYMKWKIMKFL